MEREASKSDLSEVGSSETDEETTRYMLEWNFMASRVNAILSVMRAHRDLHIPLDVQYISDGLTIERVSTISSNIA